MEEPDTSQKPESNSDTEPHKKKTVILCAEEDYKWAIANKWDEKFPKILEDHHYCWPGQKYIHPPDELPEPEKRPISPLIPEQTSPFVVPSRPPISRLRLSSGAEIGIETIDSGTIISPPTQKLQFPVRSQSPLKPGIAGRAVGQIIYPVVQPSRFINPSTGQRLEGRLIEQNPRSAGRAPLITPGSAKHQMRARGGQSRSLPSQDVPPPVLQQEAPMHPTIIVQNSRGLVKKADGSPIKVLIQSPERRPSPTKPRIIRQAQHLQRRIPVELAQNTNAVPLVQSTIEQKNQQQGGSKNEEKKRELPEDLLNYVLENQTKERIVEPSKTAGNNEAHNRITDIIKEGVLGELEPPEEGIVSPKGIRSPQRILHPNYRQRNMSTSSGGSQGLGRGRPLLRPPGSSPVRTNLDPNFMKNFSPPVRNGVRSNLKPVGEYIKTPPTPKRRGRPKSESKNQETNLVRCICGTEENHPKLGWVQCDGCDVWQHSECVGYDAIVEKDDKYYCESCEMCDVKRIRRRPKTPHEAKKYVEHLMELNNKPKTRKPYMKRRKNEISPSPSPSPSPPKERATKSRKSTEMQSPTRGSISKRARGFFDLIGTNNIFDGNMALNGSCSKHNVAEGAYGLVAETDIPEGSAVAELMGHICLPTELEKPHAFNPYLFFYDGLIDPSATLTTAEKQENQICIDARKSVHDGRVVRRCCRPNSTIRHTLSNKQATFYIVTRQRVPEKEEITIPFEAGYHPNKKQCRCSGIPGANCLLEDSNFEGPGFCNQTTVEAPVAPASSPKRTPRTRKISIDAQKIKEERSEEEVPETSKEAPSSPPKETPRSARKIEEPISSKKASDKEEAKIEENFSRRGRGRKPKIMEKQEKTPKKIEDINKEIEKQMEEVAKKVPTKHSTPKQEGSRRKRTEVILKESAYSLDLSLPSERNKETREERKLREELERFARLEAKEKKTPRGRKPMKKTLQVKVEESEQRTVTPKTEIMNRKRTKNQEMEVEQKSEFKKEPIEPIPIPATPINYKKRFLKQYESQEKESPTVSPSSSEPTRRTRWTKQEKKPQEDKLNEVLEYVRSNDDGVIRRAIIQGTNTVKKKIREEEFKLPKEFGVEPLPKRRRFGRTRASSPSPPTPSSVNEVTNQEINEKSKSMEKEKSPVNETAIEKKRGKRMSVEEYKKLHQNNQRTGSPKEKGGFIPDLDVFNQPTSLPDFDLPVDEKRAEANLHRYVYGESSNSASRPSTSKSQHPRPPPPLAQPNNSPNVSMSGRHRYPARRHSPHSNDSPRDPRNQSIDARAEEEFQRQRREFHRLSIAERLRQEFSG